MAPLESQFFELRFDLFEFLSESLPRENLFFVSTFRAKAKALTVARGPSHDIGLLFAPLIESDSRANHFDLWEVCELGEKLLLRKREFEMSNGSLEGLRASDTLEPALALLDRERALEGFDSS